MAFLHGAVLSIMKRTVLYQIGQYKGRFSLAGVAENRDLSLLRKGLEINITQHCCPRQLLWTHLFPGKTCDVNRLVFLFPGIHHEVPGS
jgi:hypothetical protein